MFIFFIIPTYINMYYAGRKITIKRYILINRELTHECSNKINY